MTTVIVLVVLVVALDVAALRWGADTRDGRDWRDWNHSARRRLGRCVRAGLPWAGRGCAD